MLRVMKSLKKRWQLKCKQFQKNQQGTSAIEFAFIAPVMLLTYFAVVEISRAYIAKNRVETVTETVADLVTQGTAITSGELGEMFTVANAVLRPEEAAKINIVVTAVRTLPHPVTGQPETRVTWSLSKEHGQGTKSVGDEYNDLPEGMAKNFETLIVTELYYDHSALMNYPAGFFGYDAMYEVFGKGPKNYDRVFINKPRYSLDIPCNDC